MTTDFDPDYGTTDVARMFRVSPRTVGKWCDQGLLPHHRLPPVDGHTQPTPRRMGRQALLKFARDRGLRTPRQLADPCVLFAGTAPVCLPPRVLGIAVGGGWFEMCYRVGQRVLCDCPLAVVLGVAGVGSQATRELIGQISQEGIRPAVIVLTAEDDGAGGGAWTALGARCALRTTEASALPGVLAAILLQPDSGAYHNGDGA
jgi:hypothetical protein